MIFQWILDHRGLFPLAAMCRVLNVARSGYYDWLARRKRPATPRQQRKEELMRQIQTIYIEKRRVYGSPRVHEELVKRDVACCVNTVANYMRQAKLNATPTRRFKVMTTDSNHSYPTAPNVLDRRFEPGVAGACGGAANAAWCADITYIPTRQGWLYLAAVIDLHSRRIVGYALADHLRASLVIDALSMAIDRRLPAGAADGLLLHSDRGVQYACTAYQTLLAARGITCSMSRRANCYDNAVMESFFATLKRELIHRHDYPTHDAAIGAIVEYIEVFYNRERLHSALGYLSPADYERKAA